MHSQNVVVFNVRWSGECLLSLHGHHLPNEMDIARRTEISISDPWTIDVDLFHLVHQRFMLLVIALRILCGRRAHTERIQYIRGGLLPRRFEFHVLADSNSEAHLARTSKSSSSLTRSCRTVTCLELYLNGCKSIRSERKGRTSS